MYDLLIEELRSRRDTVANNLDFSSKQVQLAEKEATLHRGRTAESERLLSQIDGAIRVLEGPPGNGGNGNHTP
jgi:hypothetical protein